MTDTFVHTVYFADILHNCNIYLPHATMGDQLTDLDSLRLSSEEEPPN